MKQMKHYTSQLLFFFFILIISSCNTPDTSELTQLNEQGVVFPDHTYSKVVAYHFEDLEGNPIIDKMGVLNPTVKKERILKKNEIANFLSIINNEATYGGIYTRCFRPRLGIVFYSKTIPVAHISICFECSQQSSSKVIKAYTAAPIGEHGYSEEGFRQLTTFCRKLGFGQCGE